MRGSTTTKTASKVSADATRTTTTSRRRFARRQWARRWLTWRYLLVALVLVLATSGSVYAVYFSSWLTVESVEVTGTQELTRQQVLRAAGVPIAAPLAGVDLDAIEIRVRSLATVRSARVSRQWPHDVRIEVEERTPVAVIQVGDQLRNLDGDGVIFGHLGRAPDDLPRVQSVAVADDAGGVSSTSSDALREAAAVADALEPAFLATVDHLEVETVDRITLALRDGRVVRWGSAEESARKAEVLAALLGQQAEVYDVSVPGSPTTSPRA